MVSQYSPRARSLAILSGFSVLCLGFVLHQLVLSDLITAWNQRQLRSEFESSPGFAQTTTSFVQPSAPSTALPSTSVPVPDPVLARPATGTPFGVLRAPAIELDVVVVEGTDVGTLQRGPGHFEHAARFGEIGNLAIGGHRTTYGAPFADLDRFTEGDEITLTASNGLTQTYRAMGPQTALGSRIAEVTPTDRAAFIIDPTQVWVTNSFGDNRITLIACHPKRSAKQRIVVQAALVAGTVGSQPPKQEPPALPGTSLPAGTTSTPQTLIPDSVSPDEMFATELLTREPSTTVPAIVMVLLELIGWTWIDQLRRSRRGLRSALLAAIPWCIALWWTYELVEQSLPSW